MFGTKGEGKGMCGKWGRSTSRCPQKDGHVESSRRRA